MTIVATIRKKRKKKRTFATVCNSHALCVKTTHHFLQCSECTFVVFVLTAQFTVQPLSVERADGLEAVFSCQYQVEGITVTYDWAINNTIVTTETETIRVRRPSSPGGPTTLIILATPQHNNSVVQCVAVIRNGIATVRGEVSITATLTVHGE